MHVLMTESTSTHTESLSPVDLSGRELGDFRLLRRIGRGAMAQVYLAQQRSLSRQVAVKVLKRELATDDSYIKRFQHEARSAASLVHANIVQIYEVGRVDGIHFIALEYVRGRNLRQYLDQNGPLDIRTAVAVMRQIAAALAKAAQGGLIHRDIKPENIMISVDGEVKVADFGLSRTGGDGHVNLTQVGVTMGTPLYMSPEQAEGKPLDPRSDLYSFGVTCYHMLAGRPPFDGETALAVAVQHVRNQPRRLENVRPDLPQGLCRVVHRLLEKDPADRYQRPAELLQDLRTLQVELGEADSDAWQLEGIEDWSTAEMIAVADARVAATQRLDALMKSSAHKQHPPRAWWPKVLVAVTLAFFIGAIAAWRGREADLLAQPGDGTPIVERMETAEAQYFHALALQNDAGYQAVWNYFPEDDYFSNRAKQQLARLYLDRGDLRAANRLFRDLANLEAAEVKLRAFGLAGQILVYEQRGENKSAAGLLAELLPLREHLDPSTDKQIDAVRRRLQSDAGS